MGEDDPEDLGLQIFEEVGMLQRGSTNETMKDENQVRTFGLGYVPTLEEIQEMKQKMRSKRGEWLYDTPMTFSNIKSTFLQPAYVEKLDPARECKLPGK